MSLTSTFQIGRSALIASQYGLNVTGNNMANASSPAYSRQTTQMQGIRSSNEGGFSIGRGVFVRAVNREVDEALLTRLRSSMAESGRAREEAAALTQLEGVLNELTDFDMSSQLDDFFNTWSDAANLIGSESTVVEQGDRLASYVQRLRSDLGTLRQQIDEQIYDRIEVANGLFDEVAALNEQIASV
ncbi:MAG: flagellar hook-associated protein FlgK, partial [Planctomycetota bacterium]